MITKHGPRLKRQIHQVGLIFAIAFVLSTIGLDYAAAQDSTDDTPIAKLRIAGRLIDLDLSQPLPYTDAEGEPHTLTVTLHWVYADVYQIVFGYSVEGLTSNIFEPANFDAPLYFPLVTLGDSAGNEFAYTSDGVDMGPSDDGSLVLRDTARYSFDRYYLAGNSMVVDEDYLATVYGDALPDELDLLVNVELVLMTPSLSKYEEIPGATAQIALTVPLEHGIAVTPMLTDTQHDLTATLESLRVTPTRSRAVICYDLPDSDDWQPHVALRLDDTEAVLIESQMTQIPTSEDVSRCFTLDFDAALSDNPVQATLTLDRIRLTRSESPEFWEEVRLAVLAHGIEIEVYPEPHTPFRIVSAPEDIDEGKQWQLIGTAIDDLLPVVEGPWVFVVPLDE